ARLLRTPQLAAVVQVVAHREAGTFGCGERLGRDFGCAVTQGRRDAADMVPARAGKYWRPIDTAGSDAADRRSRAIVQHTTDARPTDLHEVQTHPAVGGPLDLRVHTVLTGLIGDHAAECVVGKSRDPAR